MAERLWTGLDAAVVDGQACVVCGRSLRFRRSRWVPVGRSHTGSPVLACAGDCAQQAAATPGVVPIPVEALTAGGIAFLAVLDRAGGDLHRADPDALIAETVRAAAAVVVAAEVRRIAAELQARADELDPAGGER